ncbi:MAG: hypothetical protein WCC03_10125 [Candidatus Acidiferrales bacterium]
MRRVRQSVYFMVLSADPATDATNFAKVRYTVRGGRVVYSASAH